MNHSSYPAVAAHNQISLDQQSLNPSEKSSFLNFLRNNPLSRGVALLGAVGASYLAENLAAPKIAAADIITFDTMSDPSNYVQPAFDHFWDRSFAPESFATGIIGTPIQGQAGHQVSLLEVSFQFAALNASTSQYEYVNGPLDLSTMNLSFRAFYVPNAADFSVTNIEEGTNVFIHDLTYDQLMPGSGSSLGLIGNQESYYFGFDASSLNWQTPSNLGYVGLLPFYTDYETNFGLDLLSGMTLSSNLGATIGTGNPALHAYGGDFYSTTLFDKSGYDHGIARVSLTSSIPEPTTLPLIAIAVGAAVVTLRRRRD